MIGKLFWVALGAAVGVLVVRQVTRTAQQYSPQGIAGSVGEGLSSLGDGLREFAEAVRESAAEREEVLRAAVSGEIDGRGVADLLENPASEHPASEVDDR